MAKQNKGYNYRGSPRGSKMAYDAEIDRLRSTPTAKQRKFHRFLLMTLKEHGIDPGPAPYGTSTRAELSREINRLVALCTENGIETASNNKPFVTTLSINPNGFRGQTVVKERLVLEDDLD